MYHVTPPQSQSDPGILVKIAIWNFTWPKKILSWWEYPFIFLSQQTFLFTSFSKSAHAAIVTSIFHTSVHTWFSNGRYKLMCCSKAYLKHVNVFPNWIQWEKSRDRTATYTSFSMLFLSFFSFICWGLSSSELHQAGSSYPVVSSMGKDDLTSCWKEALFLLICHFKQEVKIKVQAVISRWCPLASVAWHNY